MVRVRMTKCPNPNRIIEYLQDALPPQAAEEMRQHLLGCSACRARAEAIGLPDASPTVETAVTSFGMAALTTGRALITSGLPKEVPAVPTDEITGFTHDFSYGLDEQSVSADQRTGDAVSNIELSIPSLRALSTGDRPEADTGMLRVGTKIAHYVVTRLLGRGGMGEVYLARDTHLGRKVALKVIRPNHLEDQDSIDRFLLEARMTARFNHPHIITIYGVGVHDGLPYVALEYLEGQNLRERCRDEQPTLQESLRICLADGEADH